MALRVNQNRLDQALKITGLSNGTGYDFHLTIGTAGGTCDASNWSYLVDDDNGNISTSFRVHSVPGDKIYFYGGSSLQFDSGTVYNDAARPATSTFNSLAVNGAVLKIFDVTATANACFLMGTDDTANAGVDIEVTQVEIRLASDSSLLATFDTSTPAAQYTNSGYTLDVLNYAAADTTAPTFTAGPNAGSATAVGHTISSSIDEAGTIYAIRLADGATPTPSSAQVKAGTDGNDTPLAASEKKSSAIGANTNLDLVFTGGAASTAYDYYVVAEDDSLNIQASPTLVEATTSAGSFSIDGGVLTYGAAFTFTYAGMASVASPITIGPDSQGNSLNVAITDNADGTGSGTMPSLPSSGTSNLILIEDSLTVTATEV